MKLIRSTIPTSIEIVENFQDESVQVSVDPTQIHQVLMNLCSNANQAMGEEGGILTVEVKNLFIMEKNAHQYSLKPGCYVEMVIQDTGPGMTAEIQERIFEPFFTTKSKVKGTGTGLGLSVVHGVIQASDGEIKVESKVGEGTIFKVYLPVVDVSVKEVSGDAEKTPVVKGGGKVLFVDDESELVNIGVYTLKFLNYDPVGFTNSEKALAEFMTSPDSFDAVITDQVMPGLAGNELATRILDVRPDIPIFLCTGFSEKMTEESAAEVGFSGFFLKPVSMSTISSSLKSAIKIKSC